MSKVLVTGASGFIGQHLVEALTARGEQVACLVRRTSQVAPLQKCGARLVPGDITDAASLAPALSDVDVVYHLAGLTKSLTSAELFAVNEQGTRNLVQACAAQLTPPVTVLVSSLAAAGPSTPTQPRIEADPPRPISNYGRSKRAGELAAIAWSDRVPLTIVRPPIVYGEGDVSGTLGIFEPIAKWRVHPVPGTGRARFSLIHARDLANALIAAAEQGARAQPSAAYNGAHGIYFAAGDEQPTYSELGHLIAHAVGRKRIIIFPWHGDLVLFPLGVAAEIIGRIRRRPLSLNLDKVREAKAGSWTCSARVLREEAGFVPTVPLGEGLRETAEWYRRGGLL